jgi:hypothetical protein
MSTEEEKKYSRVPQFQKNNVTGWLAEFKGFLMRYDLAHLALATDRPRGAEDREVWDKRNAYCISYLQEAVRGPENRNAKQIVFAHENENKSARQICNILSERFLIRDSRIIHAAQENFVRLKLQPGELATSFIVRIEEAREGLRRLGKELDEEVDLVGRLIAGLEPDGRYTALASALKMKDNITWEYACNSVRADDQALREQPNETATITESAKLAHHSGSCQICGKGGHTAKNCHFRFNKPSSDNNNRNNQGYNTRSSSSSKDITCYFCKKKGHKSFECRKKKKYDEKQKSTASGGDQKESSQTGHKRKSWDDAGEGEFSGMLQQKSGKRSNTQA